MTVVITLPDASPEAVATVAVLGAALVLTALAAHGAAQHFRTRSDERAAAEHPIDWPMTWQQAVEANSGVPPLSHAEELRIQLNYRHKAHCPVCGRFARKWAGMDNVTDCKIHGLTVAVATGPIGVINVNRDEGTDLHLRALAEPEARDLAGRSADRINNRGSGADQSGLARSAHADESGRVGAAGAAAGEGRGSRVHRALPIQDGER